MPERNTIAIFAATEAQSAYLADIARLAGCSTGQGDAVLALIGAGASVSAGVDMPMIRFGARDERSYVRVFEGAVKASTVIAAIRSAMQGIQGVPAKIRIGSGELDVRDSLWSKNGETVRLTEKETAILVYLNSAGDKAVPREELLQHVWSYVRDVETHTLETHIYRLRQKIEDDPSVPKILITQGDGYMLAG